MRSRYIGIGIGNGEALKYSYKRNHKISDNPKLAAIPSIMPPTTGSSFDRTDSSAELMFRINMALETMKKAAAAADRTNASTSIPPLFSLSHNTIPAQDSTNNLPAISRSTSSAATDWWQWQSVTSKISSTASSLTVSTTPPSDDCFSLGCPLDMPLSYSGSMHGLEAVPLDASNSNSLAFGGSNNEDEDADAVVAVNDNHAQLGCLSSVKDLADKITLAARDFGNFYNGVIHYRPPVCKCGCGVETKGLPFL